ncbi:MAG: 3-phosphoshikimate 1-carboxyvinyltransferase [Bacteroidales bacterium]|nr:3-phosphoshikimate 1-carboxyvinyltransferase [Bacteroidales bacterium]
MQTTCCSTMIARIFPPSIHSAGPLEVRLPLSKSVSIRRLLLDAIASAETPIEETAVCDDTTVTRRALMAAGEGRSVDVDGCGAAMRFLTAWFAGQAGGTTTLGGSRRLSERPVGALVEALRSLGAEIEYLDKEGFPPLLICGRRLQGGSVSLPGDISSQYVSALMLIAPMLSERLVISVMPPVVSRPYIAMTAGMIEIYGGRCRMEDSESGELRITLDPSRLVAPATGIMEPDWSAASYWYEVSALTGCTLPAVEMPRESLQGDSAVTDYFSKISSAKAEAREVRLNLADTPDLAPTLAATCCGLSVPFRFEGLAGLRIKECDRLTAIAVELGRLGYEVKQEGEGALSFSGQRRERLQPVRIATYGDHRMAMAMAPLAVVAPGLEIENPAVVGKSYPGFWDDLIGAGYVVNMIKL